MSYTQHGGELWSFFFFVFLAILLFCYLRAFWGGDDGYEVMLRMQACGFSVACSWDEIGRDTRLEKVGRGVFSSFVDTIR